MVNTFKIIAVAGALGLVAAPAFAQNGVPIVGDVPIISDLPLVGNNATGLDMDPFHIFTPAVAAAPEAAPAPVMKHHHHMMMHHKMMMHHHGKMMMHHKMMKKAM